MNNIGTARRWALVATAAVAFGTIAAACSDDDTAAPTTTVAETPAEFLARAQSTCPSFQPEFDTFYSDHPTPTAEDYAAFLPTQIDGLDAMAQCIKDSRPPTEVQDEVQAVTDAMDVVIGDLQKAQDAAEAGDLDGTNQWVGQMHDVDVAKIDEVFSALTAAAGV